MSDELRKLVETMRRAADKPLKSWDAGLCVDVAKVEDWIDELEAILQRDKAGAQPETQHDRQIVSATIMKFRKMLDRLGIHGYYNEMQNEFPEDWTPAPPAPSVGPETDEPVAFKGKHGPLVQVVPSVGKADGLLSVRYVKATNYPDVEREQYVIFIGEIPCLSGTANTPVEALAKLAGEALAAHDAARVAETEKRQWISVEDSLPQLETLVLISTNEGGAFTGKYRELKGKTFWMPTGNGTYPANWKVTHWQPMPRAALAQAVKEEKR